MTNIAEKVRMNTGKCPVVFATLGKPNTKFKEEGEYSVKVRLTKEIGEVILAKVIEIENEAYQKAYADALKESKKKANSIKRADNRPCAEERDDDDNPTGFYVLNCKMKASGKRSDGTTWIRKPAIYDSQLKLITNTEELMVYGGSIVRVGFTLAPYIAPIGVGVSAVLDGVQIVKLCVGVRTAEDMGFEAEEEGYTANASAEGPTLEDAVPKKAGEGEEDEGDY
jgi:hypothetical protein